MTADLRDLHQQGRLSQVCPKCGVTEAAGGYCTACLTRTGEAVWRRGELGEVQRDALARSRATRKQEAANPAVLSPASDPPQSAPLRDVPSSQGRVLPAAERQPQPSGGG